MSERSSNHGRILHSRRHHGTYIKQHRLCVLCLWVLKLARRLHLHIPLQLLQLADHIVHCGALRYDLAVKELYGHVLRIVRILLLKLPEKLLVLDEVLDLPLQILASLLLLLELLLLYKLLKLR